MLTDEGSKIKTIKAEILTDEFRKWVKGGRAGKFELDLGWEQNLQVIVIYGKSGGSKKAIRMTEAIIDAARQEVDAGHYLATMLVGDLNANPEKLKTVKEMIKNDQWTDVGKHASWWGGKDEEPTCQPRPKATPTRIDAVLANKAALAWIKGFEVIAEEGIPTHRILQIRVRRAGMEERTYAKSLPSLKKLFENKLKGIIESKEETERSRTRSRRTP